MLTKKSIYKNICKLFWASGLNFKKNFNKDFFANNILSDGNNNFQK